jgi:type I restriction enzyme S subunit
LGMEWDGGDIPALSARNVKMGHIDFEEETYFGSEALYKRWMCSGDPKKDDIVVTMEAPLGNVALIPDNKKYILSQRTILLQTNQEKVCNQFLLQLMSAQIFQRLLAKNATGSTAQGIQRKKFEKLEVILPPLPEQQAIAEVLSDVDALIAALDRLIAKKRAIKQGAMQQLLTGQIRLPGFSGRPGYKQTKVGMIPEDWEIRRLEELCSSITDGTHYTPKYVSDGIPF